MQLAKDDKKLLLESLETETARVKRAVNAATNQSIKEILSAHQQALQALYGRVSQEVAK